MKDKNNPLNSRVNFIPERNRLIYFCLIVVVVILGIASRKFSHELPVFVAEYSGDTLWALMVYFIFGFIFVKYTSLRIAIMALIFSYAIEFTQIYQSEWINSIRNTKLGGLVLGYGFLWSDLVCYTAGIITGVSLEKYFSRHRSRVNSKHTSQ
ncbi:MAG: DUF2809 domain-containing protein [Ignavibacteria bacterium]